MFSTRRGSSCRAHYGFELVKELATASLCVGDLTGTKPNVMWEMGYAMARTSQRSSRPRTLAIFRSTSGICRAWNTTVSISAPRWRPLGAHGHRHTVFSMRAGNAATESDNLVGELLHQVGELKLMEQRLLSSGATASRVR